MDKDLQVAEQVSAYGNGHVSILREKWNQLKALPVNSRLLFADILFSANWKQREWFNRYAGKMQNINRGEFVTSLTHLSEDSKLSVRNVRTALSHLVKANLIYIEKSTRQYTMIKVLDYDSYGSDNSTIDTRPTRHRHGTDTAPTLTEEGKEGKERKEYKEHTRVDSRIHIDKLTFNEPMKTYADSHGLNGHGQELFVRMLTWCEKEGILVASQRSWNARFRTFVDRAPQFNKDLFAESDKYARLKAKLEKKNEI